jgi:hypothetical protein
MLPLLIVILLMRAETRRGLFNFYSNPFPLVSFRHPNFILFHVIPSPIPSLKPHHQKRIAALKTAFHHCPISQILSLSFSDPKSIKLALPIIMHDATSQCP